VLIWGSLPSLTPIQSSRFWAQIMLNGQRFTTAQYPTWHHFCASYHDVHSHRQPTAPPPHCQRPSARLRISIWSSRIRSQGPWQHNQRGEDMVAATDLPEYALSFLQRLQPLHLLQQVDPFWVPRPVHLLHLSKPGSVILLLFLLEWCSHDLLVLLSHSI